MRDGPEGRRRRHRSASSRPPGAPAPRTWSSSRSSAPTASRCGYYREKVRAERVVESSGLPWTILRATQFHDFLVQMFTSAARTGLLPVLAGTSFQPVALDDVAARLADLVDGPAQGRASDLGGPEIRPMADLARAWLAATGRRRAVVPLRLPGAIARGYRDGAHLTPEHADGVGTFEQFLAARAEVAR